MSSVLGSRIYGCDACQQVCPWNKFAKPTVFEEFSASADFLQLDSSIIENMTGGEFKRMFKESAIARAGLKGLKRNLESVKKAFDSSKLQDVSDALKALGYKPVEIKNVLKKIDNNLYHNLKK